MHKKSHKKHQTPWSAFIGLILALFFVVFLANYISTSFGATSKDNGSTIEYDFDSSAINKYFLIDLLLPQFDIDGSLLSIVEIIKNIEEQRGSNKQEESEHSEQTEEDAKIEATIKEAIAVRNAINEEMAERIRTLLSETKKDKPVGFFDWILDGIADMGSKEKEPLSWPVSSHIVNPTGAFKDPNYPYLKNGLEHLAIDIFARQGERLNAAEDGVIDMVVGQSETNDYSYIRIRHSNGLLTVYGHLSKIMVTQGQQIKRGEQIGLTGGEPGTVGAGYLSTGPHLHFEVWTRAGKAVNPILYLYLPNGQCPIGLRLFRDIGTQQPRCIMNIAPPPGK